jgi:hypothetical protein
LPEREGDLRRSSQSDGANDGRAEAIAHDQPQILSAKKSLAEQFFLQVAQFGAAIAATVVQQEA